MIKDEKRFDKHMKIWEKVSNVIKSKFLKAKKKFNIKESFQCFYIPVILIDSNYRKDENYYPKMFFD